MISVSKWISFVLFLHQYQVLDSNQCAPCRCYGTNNNHIQCFRRNLTSVPLFPLNYTRTVKWLWLDSNHIMSLESGIFKNYTNLEWLDLSHNRISTLLPNTFQGLKTLEELDFGHNRIKTYLKVLSMAYQT